MAAAPYSPTPQRLEIFTGSVLPWTFELIWTTHVDCDTFKTNRRQIVEHEDRAVDPPRLGLAPWLPWERNLLNAVDTFFFLGNCINLPGVLCSALQAKRGAKSDGWS